MPRASEKGRWSNLLQVSSGHQPPRRKMFRSVKVNSIVGSKEKDWGRFVWSSLSKQCRSGSDIRCFSTNIIFLTKRKLGWVWNLRVYNCSAVGICVRRFSRKRKNDWRGQQMLDNCDLPKEKIANSVLKEPRSYMNYRRGNKTQKNKWKKKTWKPKLM